MGRNIKQINFVDFFAGIGGMRYAFENVTNKNGYKSNCILTTEIKKSAIKVYSNAFNIKEEEQNHIKNIKDCLEQDYDKIDFILAGFPCQPFSTAGKGLGFEDARGTLFFEILRFIIYHKPIGFLFENVEGLEKHDNGKTLQVILNSLREIGYNVNYIKLNAIDFGLPQNRNRIYIYGSLQKNISINKPKSITKRAFKDIRDHNISVIESNFTKILLSKYSIEYLQGKTIKDKRAGENNIHSWNIETKGTLSSLEKEIMEFILSERRTKSLAKKYEMKWKDGLPVPQNHIFEKFEQLGYDICILEQSLDILVRKTYLKIDFVNNIKCYSILNGLLSYPITRILDDKKITPTIVATDVSRLGVVEYELNGIRNLSTKELLKLFGYPENYPLNIVSKKEQYDLIGNTICVPVVEYILENMITLFENI